MAFASSMPAAVADHMEEHHCGPPPQSSYTETSTPANHHHDSAPLSTRNHQGP